jgi:hypothetical protein
MQALRRIAADDSSKKREWTLLAPEDKLAKAQRIDAAPARVVERVAHEILDRGEHRGNELRVLGHRLLRRHVLDQEARSAVNQKDVFNAIDQSVLEHDLGEGSAGPNRFPPPFQPT